MSLVYLVFLHCDANCGFLVHQLEEFAFIYNLLRVLLWTVVYIYFIFFFLFLSVYWRQFSSLVKRGGAQEPDSKCLSCLETWPGASYLFSLCQFPHLSLENVYTNTWCSDWHIVSTPQMLASLLQLWNLWKNGVYILTSWKTLVLNTGNISPISHCLF